MKNYEIKVVPNVDSDGETYWTASFPAVPGVRGGGSTAEEAIGEAEANLEEYFAYLESENRELPKEYEENPCSGKIALRVPRSVHRELLELAENEGVSLNAILNTAISTYLGKSQYDYELDKRIEALQELALKSLNFRIVNATANCRK